jgi:hypothetical protein
VQANYWSKNLKGRELGRLGTDGRIIRIDFRAVGWEVVD